MIFYHFKGTADYPWNDAAVFQCIVRIWQLNELRQGIRIEHERKLVSRCAPVGYRRRYRQVHLESALWARKNVRSRQFSRPNSKISNTLIIDEEPKTSSRTEPT